MCQHSYVNIKEVESNSSKNPSLRTKSNLIFTYSMVCDCFLLRNSFQLISLRYASSKVVNKIDNRDYRISQGVGWFIRSIYHPSWSGFEPVSPAVRCPTFTHQSSLQKRRCSLNHLAPRSNQTKRWLARAIPPPRTWTLLMRSRFSKTKF